MKDKAKIIELIFSAIDEVNQLLPKEQRLDKAPDTILSGGAAGLDSLGLINLIVALEQKIEDEFKTVILTDEIAMSRKNSPFRNVQTLADYLARTLRESSHE